MPRTRMSKRPESRGGSDGSEARDRRSRGVAFESQAADQPRFCERCSIDGAMRAEAEAPRLGAFFDRGT